MLSGLIAVMMAAGIGGGPSAVAVTPGTVSIDPVTPPTLPAETSRLFDDAVRRAMIRARFTPLPGQGHGRYVASVTVTRTSRGVVTAGRPAAPPPLASLNGSVSLALPAGDRLSDLVVTELTVVIARRDDPTVRWSGSAVTARVTGTRAGATELVAQTLADAAIGQFPYQADSAISVP